MKHCKLLWKLNVASNGQFPPKKVLLMQKMDDSAFCKASETIPLSQNKPSIIIVTGYSYGRKLITEQNCWIFLGMFTGQNNILIEFCIPKIWLCFPKLVIFYLWMHLATESWIMSLFSFKIFQEKSCSLVKNSKSREPCQFLINNCFIIWNIYA